MHTQGEKGREERDRESTGTFWRILAGSLLTLRTKLLIFSRSISCFSSAAFSYTRQYRVSSRDPPYFIYIGTYIYIYVCMYWRAQLNQRERGRPREKEPRYTHILRLLTRRRFGTSEEDALLVGHALRVPSLLVEKLQTE